MFSRGLIVSAFVLAFAGIAVAKERVWTDSSGRTVRGEFVAERDGEVTLLVSGKLVTLAVDRLSEKDRQAVRDLAAGKEVAEDPLAGFGSGEPLEKPAKEVEEASAAQSDSAVPDDTSAPSEKLPSLTKKPRTTANRTWSDTSGQQFTGKFVRIFDGKVVLSRGSRHVTVGFYELSAADQDYLRELLKARGDEGLIPPLPSIAAGTNSAMAPVMAVPPPGAGAPAIDDGSNAPAGAIEYGPGTATPASDPAPTIPAGSPSDPSMYGPSGYAADSVPSTGPLPSTRPPSAYPAPAYPSSAPGSTDEDPNRQVGMCSGCRRSVTGQQSQGTHCPHCGTKWMFNTVTNRTASQADDRDAGSGPRLLSLDGEAAEQTVRSGVIVVVAVIAITVLVGGVIALALAIASASRGGKQYREYR